MTNNNTPQQAGALSGQSIEAALEEWFNHKWPSDAHYFQGRMRAAINAALAATAADGVARAETDDARRMRTLCRLLDATDDMGNGFPGEIHAAFQEGSKKVREALDAHSDLADATATPTPERTDEERIQAYADEHSLTLEEAVDALAAPAPSNPVDDSNAPALLSRDLLIRHLRNNVGTSRWSIGVASQAADMLAGDAPSNLVDAVPVATVLTRYRINLEDGSDAPDEDGGYFRDDDVLALAEDLRALIQRLAHSLRKAAPDNELPDAAMDYLKRAGLCTSPLRTAPPASTGTDAQHEEIAALKHDLGRYMEISAGYLAEIEELRLGTAAHAGAIPAGWKLVPIEPTIEMEDAANRIQQRHNNIYQAMLAAAPTPPVSAQAPVAPQYRYLTYTGQCGWLEVSKEEYDASEYRKKRELIAAPAQLAEHSVTETALSDAYYFVTGKSPAWSETFTRGDAVEEIKQSVNLLRRRAIPDDVSNVLQRMGTIVTWEPAHMTREELIARLENVNTMLYNVLSGRTREPFKRSTPTLENLWEMDDAQPAVAPVAVEWISVGEQLPEIGTWCNVLYDRNEGDYFDRLNKPRYSVYGAQLRNVDGEGYATWQKWQMPDGGPIAPMYLVTHWMPLPAAPAPAAAQEGKL